MNIFFVLIISLLIISCGGGGALSSNEQSNSHLVQPLSVTYEPFYSTGVNESGLRISDARPFQSQSIIAIRVTNTLKFPLTEIGAGLGTNTWASISGYEFSSVEDISKAHATVIRYTDITKSDLKYNFIQTVGTHCDDITKENPLQPNQSCVVYSQIIENLNFGDRESFNIPVIYGYMHPEKGRVSTIRYLPQPYLTVQVGRWYTDDYDLHGNPLGYVIANTESDGDYLYINSTQKIKVNYDIDGIAQLDFSTLTTCIGTCTVNGVSYNTAADSSNIKGLNTTSYYYRNEGNNVYRENYPLHELIPNISKVYAVQSDGTLVGINSITGQAGCFNNDGSNFRPFSTMYGYAIGHVSGTVRNVNYKQTNWIPVSGTEEQPLWRVTANTSGVCTLDVVNSFNQYAIMNSQQGRYSYQPSPQITQNGVFSVVQYKDGTRHLKFYKYPPLDY